MQFKLITSSKHKYGYLILNSEFSFHFALAELRLSTSLQSVLSIDNIVICLFASFLLIQVEVTLERKIFCVYTFQLLFHKCFINCLQSCYFFIGEVENAEERTERAKACPCPVHARRGRKMPKDRLRVWFSSTSCQTYFKVKNTQTHFKIWRCLFLYFTLQSKL